MNALIHGVVMDKIRDVAPIGQAVNIVIVWSLDCQNESRRKPMALKLKEKWQYLIGAVLFTATGGGLAIALHICGGS